MPNPLKLIMATAGVSSAGGTLWAFGNPSSYGTLGDGASIGRSSPVQIGTDTWIDAQGSGFAVAAVKSDGTLWTWGQNYKGTLAQGDVPNRSSPVQVGSLTDWSNVPGATTGGIVVVKSDGTLWNWGQATHLGDGVVPAGAGRRSSPVQVGSGTDWSKVSNNRSGQSFFIIKTS